MNNKKPKNFNEVCSRLYKVVTNGPHFYDPNNQFNGLPLIDLFAKLIASDTGLLFFGNIVNCFSLEISWHFTRLFLVCFFSDKVAFLRTYVNMTFNIIHNWTKLL